jgi:hypothetical protein
VQLEKRIQRIQNNAYVRIPFDPDDEYQPTVYQKLVWSPLRGMQPDLAKLKDPSRLEKNLTKLLTERGATEETCGVLAGSVLQIAKQVLSCRFDRKPSELRNVKMIGSQSIVEVIWESRNHAIHCEEQSPPSGLRTC